MWEPALGVHLRLPPTEESIHDCGGNFMRRSRPGECWAVYEGPAGVRSRMSPHLSASICQSREAPHTGHFDRRRQSRARGRSRSKPKSQKWYARKPAKCTVVSKYQAADRGIAPQFQSSFSRGVGRDREGSKTETCCARPSFTHPARCRRKPGGRQGRRGSRKPPGREPGGCSDTSSRRAKRKGARFGGRNRIRRQRQ